MHIQGAETMHFIEFQFDTCVTKKSFSIDLELDIINKEIDSNLEMRTFTKTTPVLVSILMVSLNRETSFSPNSS